MEKPKILIVDDEEKNIKLLKAILYHKHYQILEACSGEHALNIIDHECPDLLLLDVMMPGINGFKVCEALRKDQNTKDIPVIFVTALIDDETIKEAFKSGGTDYIKKPVNKVELLARIESALNRKKLIEKTIEEERLRGIIEMAGAICHEMNQPLTIVSGISELLIEDTSMESPIYQENESDASMFSKASREGTTSRFVRLRTESG